jgi:DNA-binding CsgD family transcriptional regulator
MFRSDDPPIIAERLALLSKREFEVLHCIRKGMTAAETAETLRISMKTVFTYRAQILRKLNFRTVSELRLLASNGRALSSQRGAVPRIQSPPGSTLRALADFFFSRRTYLTVLQPTLADLQDEYFQALADHRPWKARMARVRGYWSFWSAFFAQLPVSLIRKMAELWKLT